MYGLKDTSKDRYQDYLLFVKDIKDSLKVNNINQNLIFLISLDIGKRDSFNLFL